MRHACCGRTFDERHGSGRPAMRAAIIEEELALAACGLTQVKFNQRGMGFPPSGCGTSD